MALGTTVTLPPNLSYESGTVAYDPASGNYLNPQTGAVYGKTPPSGYWPATTDPTYNAYVKGVLAGTTPVVTGGVAAGVAAGTLPASDLSVQSTQTSTSASQTAAGSSTATASSNAPQASATTVNSGSLSNLLTGAESYLTANPLIGLALLAAVAFMFMGGEERHARRS